MSMRHLIKNLETENNFFLPDVKKAIKMQSESWKLVTPDTIQNCFKHYDILSGKIIDTQTSIIEDDITDKLKTYDILLKTYVAEAKDEEILSVNEILEKENEMITDEMFTLKQIVEITSPKCKDEPSGSNDIVYEKKTVSLDEAKRCL